MAQPHAIDGAGRQRALSADRADTSLVVLGCRVDRVDSAAAMRRIAEFLAAEKPAHVVTLGAEMANLAYGDARYRDVINAADLVVPDTIGIVLAAKMLGKPVPERVAGIELLEHVCAHAAASQYPVYFLGGEDGVAAAAANALAARHAGLRIAGYDHGYFNPESSREVSERIRASNARVILAGLGFPRQEYWIHDNIARLGPAVCIGVGGSFDVISGRMSRAPLVVRRAGLEWLYRLATEPRRFRRQLALPVFAVRAVGQAVTRRAS